MMKRTVAFLAVIALSAASLSYADYSVSLTGDWPASWPKELEPLRKLSRTLVGPIAENRHYAIPFAKREDLEAAWPHLLKVRSKGAPVVLVRGPNFFLGENVKAGVVVHSPPLGQADNPATPEAPINAANVRARGSNATYIELVVDGEVVDLNRIPLPADTPIIDERFKDGKAEKRGDKKDEPLEALRGFLDALSKQDHRRAYECVAPSTREEGDPITYQAKVDYESFAREAARQAASKFSAFTLGKRREEGPNRVRIVVHFEGGDTDETLLVREAGRWYVADPIHIIR